MINKTSKLLLTNLRSRVHNRLTMRQTLDRLATGLLRYLLPATALLLPLFFLPITTDFFQINKNLLLFLVGSLSLLAWSVRNIARRRVSVSFTGTTIAILLLAAVYLLSSLIQSKNPYMSLINRTSLVISLAALYLSVTSSQKNKEVINLTYAALFLSGAVVSLFSLFSFLGGFSLIPNAPAWLTAKTSNPTGGPIPFLTFVLPLIPVSLYLAFKSSRWPLRAGLLFSSALFAGASISQISLLLPGNGNAPVLLLPFTAGWSIALDIFKNARTAFLGVGPENFLAAFTRLKPAYLNLTPLWDSRFANSSNELFTVLTTTGILGAGLWLAMFLKSGGLALKHKLTAPFLLLLGVFLANLIVPANSLLLGLSFISLALVSLSLKLTTDEIKDVTDQSAFLPWVFGFISLGVLVFFWYFEGRAYAANLATYKALNLLNTNATESYNQQIVAYNLEPGNPSYRLNFSKTSLALANSIAAKKDLSDQDKTNITQLVEQSIREAKNATKLDPDNVLVWENLASIYSQLINFAQGAQDWAIASYGQALSIDPNNARLRLNLGGVYFSLKDSDSAEKMYEQAISLKPDWANAHYNLSAILKTKGNYAKALEQMRIVVGLLDPNSKDYQQATNELADLTKLAPTPAAQTPESAKQNIELVTPTPLPSPKTKVALPTDAAPNLPAK